MLDAAELADARADYVATFLGQKATVQRFVLGSNAGGGTTREWATIAANVPCRLSTPKVQRETQTAERTQAQSDLVIELPVGTDVTAKDRIVVDTVIYEVIGTDAGRAEALRLSAQVVKIGQG